jgi:hypothetical protein
MFGCPSKGYSKARRAYKKYERKRQTRSYRRKSKMSNPASR